MSMVAVETAVPPSNPVGLSSAEARRRLAAIGPNAMPERTGSGWRQFAGKFWAPVSWMLEATVVLQLTLGEYIQALVIAALLVFNSVLGTLQESKAQATLAALKRRLALSALARRDGRWTNLPAADLAPGDVVKLSIGAVVPADVTLLDGDVLLDQSTLTGESLPVEGAAGSKTFAGALVRRGEAEALVTATGPRTAFGRTAELIRTAHVVSSQQKAVFRIVRNLAVFNGGLVVVQLIYAYFIGLPPLDIVPLILTSILASIPVGLPATFTLATALGARALAGNGVLPTRLSAVDEAATMDVLCADKTGTLTQNELAVTAVHALAGRSEAEVIGLAALASEAAGADPVDRAVAEATRWRPTTALPRLEKFMPFDPATKMAEARAATAVGQKIRIVKGAFAAVAALAPRSITAEQAAMAYERQGRRVLAVAAGATDALKLVGLVALSDNPRPDSAALVAELKAMGVRTVMVTGDAAATAATIAQAIGLTGAVAPPGTMPDRLSADEYAAFAGVLPEDKFKLVKALQGEGHVVGMCGDGANDAPALRQAQIGIAVSTATDVAKSAAGVVLTEPGLAGIVAAVREGRITFQRILTYMLRSVTRKFDQMLFLTAGLFITGQAILTPTLMVIMMCCGDFMAMSSTTDNVRPSARPNDWRIDSVTAGALLLGTCNLCFCTAALCVGAFFLKLPIDALRTYAAITLVFSGQAVFYVVRERRRIWSSAPSAWMVLSSIFDAGLMAFLAREGILMAPLPGAILVGVAVAATLFAFVLDALKVRIFRRLRVT